MLLRQPSRNEVRHRLPLAVCASLMEEDAIAQRHSEWLKDAYSRTANLMNNGINRCAAERADNGLSAAERIL